MENGSNNKGGIQNPTSSKKDHENNLLKLITTLAEIEVQCIKNKTQSK